MNRQKIRLYFLKHPYYADFLVWLDHEFKHQLLNYKGMALTVKAILNESLALLTEGDRNNDEKKIR